MVVVFITYVKFMKTYRIYRVFCETTGRNYIGCTSMPLKSRMARHEADAIYRNEVGKSSIAFHADFLKYGKSAFKVCVLCDKLDKAEAFEKEIEMIEKYNSFHPNGYNKTKGGIGNLGHLWAKENGNANAEHLREYWAGLEGVDRLASDETRAKQSKAKKSSHFKAEKVMFRGVEYKSLRQCSAATELSIYIIKQELAGIPCCPSGSRPKPYTALGITYPSREDAAKHFGVSIHNLANYLKRNSKILSTVLENPNI